jgi:hypothetical protein
MLDEYVGASLNSLLNRIRGDLAGRAFHKPTNRVTLLHTMIRWLWILGLSITLLVFGGWIVLGIFTVIRFGHINGTGIGILIFSACVVWITVPYLRIKIRAEKPHPNKSEQL